MTIQGNLAEMAVADLIQHACLDGRTTRIRLQRNGESAALYIENGELVHADLNGEIGETVVHTVLAWESGTFASDPEVRQPIRSIHRSHTSLLLEAATRLDDRNYPAEQLEQPVPTPARPEPKPAQLEPEPQADESSALSPPLDRYRNLPGVIGAMLVAKDGVVIEHDLEEHADKRGSLISFVGSTALVVGSAIGLGEFRAGFVTVGMGAETILLIPHLESFIGLVLDGQTSPDHIASQVIQSAGA